MRPQDADVAHTQPCVSAGSSDCHSGHVLDPQGVSLREAALKTAVRTAEVPWPKPGNSWFPGWDRGH